MNKKVKAFLAVSIIFTVITTAYGLAVLSYRISAIEARLGRVGNIAQTVKDVRRSVVRVVGGESEGSGFVINKDGLILTNFHVVESEPNPKIVLPDGTFETGDVVAADKDADLAIIEIDKKLIALKMTRTDNMLPAEELLSIGYPLGGNLPGDASVMRGSFSSIVKDKKNNLRYINANITAISGISGGPMINTRGEVVGITTSGLAYGGMSLALSSDSIMERLDAMAASEDPLKDVCGIVFEPEKSPLEAVKAFYNYLKIRQLENAFALLSDNFLKGGTFEQWSWGYRPLLDTTIVFIKADKEVTNRVNVKLSTKDLVDNEIVYKYFEGYWDVRKVDGKWLLWKPRIREVFDPDKDWFMDQELVKQFKELAKTHDDYQEHLSEMYRISQEPGNEELTMLELYDRAKALAKNKPAL